MPEAFPYATPMGMVARCPDCDGVLTTFVESDDGRVWFGMPGVSALQIARRSIPEITTP